MSELVVGPVVGAISSTPAGAAAERYQREGYRYSYALAGLPFVDAASDDRPYARETAEYRKQQIDQGQQAGDQSLSGYWTRGQASFHRGAGIAYYELLESDGVSNRFDSSLGVDIWTPGQVTLKRSMQEITSLASDDAVAFNGGVLVLAAGVAYEVELDGTSTQRDTADSDPVTSIASDGVNAYFTNDEFIELLEPGDSASSVLWTHHVGGRTFERVFWAKDRLWAVDNTGEWYTLDTAGGTTSAGDILWTSGRAGARWSLTDSASGVFIGAGDTVWISTLDTSTANPTLGAPAAVATVGAQEVIANLGSYLGYLLVVSQRGARLGAIGGNGVVLGNLMVEADFSTCARISYRDKVIEAVGFDGVREILYEFNPLEQTSELQGAYCAGRAIGVAPSANHGSLSLPDGKLVTFCDEGVSVEGSTSSDSGWIQTGLHRFGTLEPKDFRTVTVRVSGIGGALVVEMISSAGVGTTLATLAPSSFDDNELRLRLNAPADAVGLRFTLQPDDNGDVPTLLGYQLRALPAPKRQRLIQVPVLCFDVERVGQQEVGHEGWAIGRLAALERVEEESGVVIFQDFAMGTTENVSIERIQFQRRTPSKDGRGWGGHLVLTLRKVD